MIRIETSIPLAASPERVWAVLTDFPAYPEWNPLVLRAEGAAAPYARVQFLIARPDGSGKDGWLWATIGGRAKGSAGRAALIPSSAAITGSIWPGRTAAPCSATARI